MVVFLEAPGVAWGVLGVQLGCLGGLYGALFGALGVAWGASWVLRESFGRLGRPTVPPKLPYGRPRSPQGALLAANGAPLASFWVHFGSQNR